MRAATPAIAVLVKAGVDHRTHQYDHDPARASYGREAAEAMGVAPERVLLGAISPLGQKRRLTTVVDDGVQQWDTMFCSGGHRGLEIELAPGDLVRLTGAHVAPIARREGA